MSDILPRNTNNAFVTGVIFYSITTHPGLKETFKYTLNSNGAATHEFSLWIKLTRK